MKYYKIIKDNNIIGAVNDLSFCKYQNKHNIVILCDNSEAQYVIYNDTLYHDNWMKSVKDISQSYEQVQLFEISEEDYQNLIQSLQVNEQIEDYIQESNQVEEAYQMPEDTTTIDFIKSSKINQMKIECNKIIVAGFNIELIDEQIHHFSLTMQDQMNLLEIQEQINAGKTKFYYHADNEEYKEYSLFTMKNILEQANKYKLKNLSYFNSLKSYILSLTDAVQINKITYGIEIPEQYQSDVYKQFLQ